MNGVMRSLPVWCLALALSAVEMVLTSPLATVMPLDQDLIGPRRATTLTNSASKR